VLHQAYVRIFFQLRAPSRWTPGVSFARGSGLTEDDGGETGPTRRLPVLGQETPREDGEDPAKFSRARSVGEGAKV
jgi:hypothetical protein